MKKHSRPRGKLNELLVKWPRGTVAVQTWLQSQGVSRKLADVYSRSNWVQRIGRGAYVRTGDKVEWTGGLYAIQAQLNLPIHIGGKTALEMQGYAHFIPMRDEGRRVYLFGEPGTRLPAWFRQKDWLVKPLYATANLFKGGSAAGLTEKSMGEYSIRLSAPERAMLELLRVLPQNGDFEGAKLLMEGLTSLRPELVQELLVTCRSVKAKRLFLFLAEDCNHPWVAQLDILTLDLGSGNRVIVKGGRLDPKYKITVPARPEQPTV